MFVSSFCITANICVGTPQVHLFRLYIIVFEFNILIIKHLCFSVHLLKGTPIQFVNFIFFMLLIRYISNLSNGFFI